MFGWLKNIRSDHKQRHTLRMVHVPMRRALRRCRHYRRKPLALGQRRPALGQRRQQPQGSANAP
ncbi:MAG: hypothetical protein K8R46_03300 [Pirellulales bacterium]|nr:hypothetical protein [Pirellulales bacterium]